MLGKKKIECHKKDTINKELLEYRDMKKIYIPLVNHTNSNCKPTCIKGDKVLVGTVIGKRSDHFKLPIHSSISGEVLGIEEKSHVCGEKVKCIVIKNDFLYKETDNKEKVLDLGKLTKEELEERMRKCGVIGMGGSGFPTYVKYNPKHKAKILLVNAVECEAYISSDFIVIEKYAKEIIEVLVALKKILKLEKIIIGTKKTNKKTIEILKPFTEDYNFIKIKTVRDYYPAGWERSLIKDVLHKKYDKLPIEKGIIVNNISTIHSMYSALKYNKPVVKRIITITGNRVKKPTNIIVRTGTPIDEVVEFIGGYKDHKSTKFIAGGAMTGRALENDDLIMSKNLNCVLIKSTKIKEKDTVCIRCGKCSLACPAKLSPVLMRGNKNRKELKKLHPEKCMECGLCSYVCPAKLELREQVIKAKEIIKQVNK